MAELTRQEAEDLKYFNRKERLLTRIESAIDDISNALAKDSDLLTEDDMIKARNRTYHVAELITMWVAVEQDRLGK